jgi:hypothetical protein
LSRRAQLDLQEKYFSGFESSGIETAKPEKFFAYRKRRPERPPAGKIACHTKTPNSNGRGGLAWTAESMSGETRTPREVEAVNCAS